MPSMSDKEIYGIMGDIIDDKHDAIEFFENMSSVEVMEQLLFN